MLDIGNIKMGSYSFFFLVRWGEGYIMVFLSILVGVSIKVFNLDWNVVGLEELIFEIIFGKTER